MAATRVVRSFSGVKIIALALVGVAAAVCATGCGKAKKAEPTPVPVVLKGEVDKADPAVVALRMPGSWYCTGTVIAPKYVLTAAHCFDHGSSPTSVSFASAGIYGGLGWKKTAAVHVHPHWIAGSGDYSNDVAVVELADATDVTPVPVNFDARAAKSLSEIRLVGYGPTATGWSNAGTKRVANVPVHAVAGYLQTEPGTGHCYGDSGGPSLATIDGVEKLVAVTSHGLDKICEREGGRAVRTDAQHAFLAQFVGEEPVTDGVAEEKPNEQKPSDTSASNGSIECSGEQHLTIIGQRIEVASGAAIHASDECHITLVNVDLRAPTGIVASGNAHITMTGGSIDAKTSSVQASDDAHVNLVHTELAGSKSTSGRVNVI